MPLRYLPDELGIGLAAFFRVSRDPMAIIDQDGMYVEVNVALAECLGYSREEMIGRAFLDFVHPDDRAVTARAAAGEYQPNELFENRYVRKDGEVRWLAWAGATSSGVRYGIARDITAFKEGEKRRQAELDRSRRESEENFRSLAEALPQIVWSTDPRGGNRYCNERWYEYTGVGRGEVHEFPWRPVIHPEDYPAAAEQWWHALRSGESFELEYRLRNSRDGTYRWHLARAVPVRDPAGRVLRWLGTATDIDYQKRIQEELRENFQALKRTAEDRARLIAAEKAAVEASRLKTEFLANMSHEIRTPMNGVVATAALLARTELSAEQRELVDTILQSGESLLMLVSDILDLSKIEAGKMTLETVEFDLRALLASIVQANAHEARTKGLDVRFEFPDGIAFFRSGDARRLRQIVYNLVHNAIKFTGAGFVSVSVAELRPGRLRVEVRDTGVGISEEARPRIFDAFVQADTSTTRRYGGTGLGLSICRDLTRLLGGKIDFESQYGIGSRFWIELPLAEVAGAPVARPPTLPRKVAGGLSAKVLVAEDHPINQKVIRRMLEIEGHRVEVVRNGREALARIRGEEFDFVLMDCHMPELDGFATARAMRNHRFARVRRTPIIALTADVLRQTRELCLTAGMDQYVTKPIDPRALAEAVRAVFPRGRRRDAVDETAVAKIRAMNVPDRPDLFAELLEDFAERAPERLAAIRAAGEAGDFPALEEAAHALKSVAAVVGALRVSQICRRLESCGRRRSGRGVAVLLQELPGAFEIALAGLTRLSDAA